MYKIVNHAGLYFRPGQGDDWVKRGGKTYSQIGHVKNALNYLINEGYNLDAITVRKYILSEIGSGSAGDLYQTQYDERVLKRSQTENEQERVRIKEEFKRIKKEMERISNEESLGEEDGNDNRSIMVGAGREHKRRSGKNTRTEGSGRQHKEDTRDER